MYIAFRILLYIVHFLYTSYFFALQWCMCLILAIKQRRHSHKINYDYSMINSNDSLITSLKIPNHVAILFGQEEISNIDVIKFINWCIVVGIPYITFYDHKGILQDNEYLIKQKMYELQSDIVHNIEWNSFSNNKINNNMKNEKIIANTMDAKITHTDVTNTINKHKTKIQLLSYNDSKNKIVNLAKTLAQDSHLKINQKRDITADLLNEKLTFDTKIPDPDLAIVLGNTMSTFGFLPWQCRITEFFTMPTCHDVSCDNFIETLAKFSKCQQRYGK